MERTRVLIMGAAGRDFHNFNLYFRTNSQYEVVAFTVRKSQILKGGSIHRNLLANFTQRGFQSTLKMSSMLSFEIKKSTR